MSSLTSSHDVPTEYTVGELAADLQRTLEDRYPFVRVRGEISGLKIAASGHAYFSLKDARAALDAVCWRGASASTRAALQEGAETICSGRITSYGARSKYQLIAESVEIAGVGAMMAMLEKRKQALALEGLFDVSRKRPIPFLPRCLGVITSPTGAVVHDILHRIADRFPMKVIIWPVAVQGEKAVPEIVAAFGRIRKLCEEKPADCPQTIILARGGGSIEDLWSFNDETLVRAVAACPIPVISAVGHETDVTLADFAADARAPTPTGAAEMAVPVRRDLAMRNDQAEERLQAALLSHYRRASERLERAEFRLTASLAAFHRYKKERLRYASAGLRVEALQLHGRKKTLLATAAALSSSMACYLNERRDKAENVGRVADSCSPDAALARGYAMVRQSGRIVTSAASFDATLPTDVIFRDGETRVGGTTRRRSSAKKQCVDSQRQRSLF
ncbi:MAG: exodeoxyribonuclease VII large subunit [Rickettsiales bacterium]